MKAHGQGAHTGTEAATRARIWQEDTEQHHGTGDTRDSSDTRHPRLESRTGKEFLQAIKEEPVGEEVALAGGGGAESRRREKGSRPEQGGRRSRGAGRVQRGVEDGQEVGAARPLEEAHGVGMVVEEDGKPRGARDDRWRGGADR